MRPELHHTELSEVQGGSHNFVEMFPNSFVTISHSVSQQCGFLFQSLFPVLSLPALVVTNNPTIMVLPAIFCFGICVYRIID